MKMWKNLMVVAVAILLVSAMFATQRITVESGTNLTIESEEAQYTLVAHDPAVDPSSGSERLLLENQSGNLAVELGTWGKQNSFVSAGAFAITNIAQNDLKVTNVWVKDGNDDYTDSFPAKIYLQAKYDDTSPANDSSDGTSFCQMYYNGGNGWTGAGDDFAVQNQVRLRSPNDQTPINDPPQDIGGLFGGNMTMQEDTTNSGNATYYDQGDGDGWWVYNSSATWANSATSDGEWGGAGGTGASPDGYPLLGSTTTSESNFAWVSLEILPSTDGAYTGYTMGFNVTAL